MINRTIDQIYHKETVPFGAMILRDGQSHRPGLRRRLRRASGRRDRRAVRPDRRRPQRVRAERVRPPSGDRRANFVAGTATSQFATNGTRWISASRSCRKAGATKAFASTSASDSTSTCRSTSGSSMGPLINPGREAAAADKQIHDVQIKTASRDAPASSLSGGNQQKIVVGKWLNHGAQLFIFDEPTVGVDVGTKAEIYRLFGSLLRKRRGHHPDLVLSAGGLRSRRHAACVSARAARREPRATRTRPTKQS